MKTTAEENGNERSKKNDVNTEREQFDLRP